MPSDMSEIDDVLSIRNHEENFLGIDFLTSDLKFSDIAPEMIPIPSNPDEIPLPSENPTRPSSPVDEMQPGPSTLFSPIPRTSVPARV